MRIPWSKYETALLIDLYIRVNSGMVDRNTGIKDLSRILREYAVSSGVVIDSIFRNENGISMQLANIEHLFNDGNGGLSGTSKLFKEMVTLYKNDRPEFKKILKDASLMFEKSNNKSVFEKWLIQDNKLDFITAKRTILYMDAIGAYVNKTNILSCSIYDASLNETSLIEKKLEKIIKKVCHNHHNYEKYHSAFALFKKFVYKDYYVEALRKRKHIIPESDLLPDHDVHNITKNEDPDTTKSNECTSLGKTQIVSAGSQMLEKISNILDTYFPAGCLISSFLQLNKFKKIWIQVYESDLSLTDDELVALIKQSGIEYDGKVYFISSNAREMIKSIIDPLLAEGATIFYYEMLYNKHISEFNDNHIYSKEMLKRIIDGLYSRGKHRSGYLCFDFNHNDERSVIACELHRIWKSNILMTYQEMYNSLPFVPEEKIRWTLSYTNDFVWNSNEVYASLSKVIITEEEINSLYTYISNKCDEFGSVAFKELPLDEIVGNNLELSESALWDLVRFMVCKDKFDYNGKVIVKKGEKIALDDLYRNYSIDHKVCSYDELKQLSIDNFGTSRDSQIIDSGNMAMIRVDKETFVADDMVHFDVDAIDSKLEEFIPGEFTPLKDVTALLSFPACGYPWNLFVLESFCRRFSRLFTYKNIVSNSKNAGVIVRKTSSLSYEEILIEALSESNCISNEEIALDYLFSKGYLGRRVYEDISLIINKAKELKGL